MMTKTKTKRKQRMNGQALVEFALALPLVALLILGVLEFGRAFQTKIVLTNAAREGTHYFIYDTGDAANSFENTRAAVITEIMNSGVNFDNATDQVDILCYIEDDPVGDPGYGVIDGTDDDGDGFVDSGPEVDNTCPVDSTIVIYVEKEFYFTIIGAFVQPLKIHSDARMLVP